MIMTAQDGNIKSLPRLSGKPLGIVHRGSLAVVAQEDGSVFCIDIENENILWKGEGPAVQGAQVRLIFDDRGVYVLTSTGAAGFSADGRRLWLVGLQGAAVVCSFSDEGILYSGGKDWVLYAYQVEQRVLGQNTAVFGTTGGHRYGLATAGPSFWADDPFGFESPLFDQRLDTIAGDIEKGQIGTQERSYTAYLLEILGSSIGPGNVHSPTHPTVLPSYRFRAAELLGKMASREVVPTLIRFFNDESDPLVRSALAIALGRVGGDREGGALKVLFNALIPPHSIRDERLLMGILQATSDLCGFSGPPFSEVGIGVLMNLSADDRPSRVRSTAKRELLALFTQTN
jgi:outer membrane protein assembly factor BamB